jgi:hypothetical protein
MHDEIFRFGTTIKVRFPRYADSVTPRLRKNAKATIRTLFRLLWKALDWAGDLIQRGDQNIGR